MNYGTKSKPSHLFKVTEEEPLESVFGSFEMLADCQALLKDMTVRIRLRHILLQMSHVTDLLECNIVLQSCWSTE